MPAFAPRYKWGIFLFYLSSSIVFWITVGGAFNHSLIRALEVLLLFIIVFHGALDIPYLAKKRRSFVSFLKYIIYAIAFGVLFYIKPQIAWFVFFGLSLLHFGSLEAKLFSSKEWIYFTGSASLTLMAFFLPSLFPDSLAMDLTPVFPMAINSLNTFLKLLGVPLALMAFIALKRSPEKPVMALVFAITILNIALLPSYLPFLIYLASLHSVAHIKIYSQKDQDKRNFLAAGCFSIFSVGALALTLPIPNYQFLIGIALSAVVAHIIFHLFDDLLRPS